MICAHSDVIERLKKRERKMSKRDRTVHRALQVLEQGFGGMLLVGAVQLIATIVIVGFLIYFTVVTAESLKLAGVSWNTDTGHLELVNSSPLVEDAPIFAVKERLDSASSRTVVFVMNNDEFRQTVRLPDLWDVVGQTSPPVQQDS